MTEPRPPDVRTPLRISLAVVLLLATFGSFGAGFGIMTDCTNTFSCTVTSCSPCATADGWLTGGWIAQGVLLLAGVVLAVLSARRVRLPAVRRAALVLGPLAAVLFVVTTTVATTSF
ncbi:hypothetical protein DQ244_08790 [Blastococcus sp. TBT05-19]|uniref:hypothetical protein n=1 Tax=Blastococcus sp. TBT05-19 TaxID=2250581 RepID=UPI000DEBEA00|nr:hypothetical protein [Blastococcus sp. TBT05-19]RBY92351.1 hypothetical protein DQ244_08790 [Blastococcus sp. TBT05-19]